ncbi:MAG: exodeoxyribonuclease III [Gammaproteobacteria bacterium]|nr:exodeoxyribonuclease III [Gammaproteobacteria bacterium]
MRITSINTNGIRSAHSKGFFNWLARSGADIVCVQETKAQIHQLIPAIRQPRGWHSYFMDAQKPGYSGVAIYSRHEPDEVIHGIGWDDFDAEGRYIEARFGNLSVVSLYLPSGTSGEIRQAVKYDFMARMIPWFQQRMASGREYVMCGDWNIAHQNIDLKNWRSNQKNSGFLPDERAWLDRLFGEIGLVDAFRVINQAPEQYTWWSNRGQSWDKNVGWRIDYHIVTPGLRQYVREASIYKRKRFSDHAPLTIDYDFELPTFAV